ncbi:MAG TPA: hypothetical protein VH394_30575, partial [Thermoanaerobaculia bacterium]|nr:hypothetical protein [Thermoanaerobaculia bacterium]
MQSRILSASVVIVFLAASAFAQAQSPSADLQLTKILTTPPLGGPAQFSLVVTDLGPQTINTPIAISDSMPGGTLSAALGQPLWTCTPPGPTVQCAHAGPLSPGNSFILLIDAQSSPGDRRNCAAAKTQMADPNSMNNEDCTCVEFQPCHSVSIDLTTGRENGAALPIGSFDGDWSVAAVPSTFEQTGLTWIGNPNVAWYNASTNNAAWISARPNPPTNSVAMSPGSYTYTFNFAVHPEWTKRSCALRFTYAADNTVSFTLNGAQVVSQTNPAAFNALQPYITYSFIPVAGTNSFTAVVSNNG